MPRVETDFSKRLVALRTERKVSQVAFGEALQIPRSTISGYEAEGKEPDYQTLCKMADFFGVSCDYLLGRTDERRPCDIVFRKDAGNFKKHYEELPGELRDIVSETVDAFYVLMFRDVKGKDKNRLSLYRDLMCKLRSGRGEIRALLDGVSSGVLSPSSLASVVSMQSKLKTSVDTSLDEMLDADMKFSKV